MEEMREPIVPGEPDGIVKTMDIKDIAEDKALEVVEGYLHQLLQQVSRNHRSTSRGAFNTFNYDRFLGDIDSLRAYVVKQFKEA